MNLLGRKFFGKFPLAGVVAVAVGCLLAPASARAQAYYLQYEIGLGADGGPTVQANYFGGPDESDSLLATNLSFPGLNAGASASVSATYGELQFSGLCEVDNPVDTGNGTGSEFGPAVGGGEVVLFDDTLTVTSATLPVGTPVEVQIACVYDGSITPGFRSGDPDDNTYSLAEANLDVYANVVNSESDPIGPIGASEQTNVISVIAESFVGTTIRFTPGITAAGDASDGDAGVFFGVVSTSIHSQTYVTVLTPGASYTTASGTVYPALQLPPPVLTIQGATNQTVAVSWPFAYVNYTLQQAPALTPSAWVASTNAVSEANGTNTVVLSSTAGAMYFRLAAP